MEGILRRISDIRCFNLNLNFNVSVYFQCSAKDSKY